MQARRLRDIKRGRASVRLDEADGLAEKVPALLGDEDRADGLAGLVGDAAEDREDAAARGGAALRGATGAEGQGVQIVCRAETLGCVRSCPVKGHGHARPGGPRCR